MQTFESDLQVAHRSHPAADKQDAELHANAGEAIATGHHEALHPASVMHLQRSAGNASVSRAFEERSPVLDVVGSGGGSPLDKDVRGKMESSLGHDFSDVRIHTDSKATESAKAVQAHAYTVGSDIVFQSDQYSPGSSDGQRMLAHELTHVVQQRSGPVDGTPAGGGISLSDPSDRFEREAEATADRVMSGESVGAQAGGAQGGSSVQTMAIQRDEGAEEESTETPVQAMAVQRDEGAEEESTETPVQAMAVQREDEAPEEESTETPVQAMAVQREEAPEEETEG